MVRIYKFNGILNGVKILRITLLIGCFFYHAHQQIVIFKNSEAKNVHLNPKVLKQSSTA